MAHENELKYGFDAGTIIDGVIRYDDLTKSYFIEDTDGDKFFPNEAFKSLTGEKVRFTLISFKSMDNMKDLYEKAVRKQSQESN